MIFGNDSSWRNEICLDLKWHMSHETIRIEGNSCCFACEYQRRFYELHCQYHLMTKPTIT